ncbi:MAG TPA: hypothetical protein VFQ22_01375 [Longimicrobiales bacterium]|nr:hypothetical protein [Longimicrobiales bacterium]
MLPIRVGPLVAALAIAAAAPASAQSVAGQWTMDVTLSVGSGQATFVFQVDGSTLTGTYNGLFGEQEVTGTIEGSTVRFGFEAPDAGEVSFEGVVEGDTMEGTCVYGALGSGTFTGRKTG